MTDTYDSPEIEDVLQADYETEKHVVDVRVCNVIRTDEMPTITAYRNTILVAGDRPQPILQDNPRRKRAILWAHALNSGVEAICIGSNEGQVTNFSGAMLFVTSAAVPLRYEITDAGKVWARGAIINGTDIWTGFAVSTSAAVLSIIEELWAT